MIKRIFIKLPLYLIFAILTITFIPPLLYWIITGKNLNDWMDLEQKIDKL